MHTLNICYISGTEYFSIIFHFNIQSEDYKKKSHKGTNGVDLQTLEVSDNNFVNHEENIQQKGFLTIY